MNPLDRLEKLAEKFIEGPFEQLFKRPFSLTHLRRELAQAMAAGRVNNAQGQCVAPNRYRVWLNQADYQQFGQRFSWLDEVRAIETYLTDLMHESNCTTTSQLEVQILPQSDLETGAVVITTDHTQPTLPPAKTKEASDTKKIQPVQFPPATAWQLHLADGVTPLGPLVLRLGRATANDIVLPHQTVSRYHAQLRWRINAYYVQNLSRSQPLWVNQQAINQVEPLKNGDVVQLGEVKLRVVVADA